MYIYAIENLIQKMVLKMNKVKT